MTDGQLQRDVNDAIFYDPKVDSVAIVSAVEGGVVTLRGTVGSLREKLEAQNDVQHVAGVTGVHNDLVVTPLEAASRDDADLRGAVLQALVLNAGVPSTIDAKVADSWVTLTGTASWQHQRDEAVSVVSKMESVKGVTNDVELVITEPIAPDVKQSIVDALQRNARVDAKGITVEIDGTTVVLGGTATSLAERLEAASAAWASPGVTEVINNIAIVN
ncbi:MULTISPECIES: BON domain-containing protein [Kribbella]|uniref:Osmotically-inducible protein OsmY n=1 Tax=Kribbella pratensis TaxID=2512112 RepID=A0ABY2FKH8_9ACTN|nr:MULTISPECIES: BON domain-containing protein [Kribbella]TDW86509.1 osmotically-inducible protein OsmY [Kribbella sp. VKM Ac-2566]TDW93416.1 osmotically-inducible protein OsmY [Kribbella pratensis]